MPFGKKNKFCSVFLCIIIHQHYMQMENLPHYVNSILVFTTGLTVFIFYKAANHSKSALAIILIWLIAQSILAIGGFYKVTDTLPPRFFMLIAPPLLFIVALFFTGAGKKFIDNLNMKYLTLLHTIRILVELVLFWLLLHKAVPQIMTFEGRNFDIISGLTAPVTFYYGFVKKTLSNKILLVWNFICLVLLINIVTIAILSVPFSFQKLAFDQPNIALLYFPFIWLPCCIVPLVLLSHLSSVRQLLFADRKITANKFISPSTT